MKNFLMLLGAICSIFVLTGCSDSPKDAAKEWGAALILGDEAKANARSTKGSELINQAFIARLKSDPEYVIKFKKELDDLLAGEEVINGDKAEIKVNGKTQMTFKLVDKKWLVDFAAPAEEKEETYLPEDVLMLWRDAIISGDKAGADMYVVDSCKKDNADLIALLNTPAKDNIIKMLEECKVSDVTDDSAKLHMANTKYVIKKVDGKWLIDFKTLAQ